MTLLPGDEKSVDLRLCVVLVVGKSIEPETRKLRSSALPGSWEEVAEERCSMTRMSDGSRTIEWGSQLLYKRISDREVGDQE